MKYSNFLNLLRYLKKNLPLPYPLSVRRVIIKKNLDGDCRFKNNKFFVRINKDLNESQAIDTLIHEYGHCLTWRENTQEWHGLNWGKAYSIVYRQFLEWNKENEKLQ